MQPMGGGQQGPYAPPPEPPGAPGAPGFATPPYVAPPPAPVGAPAPAKAGGCGGKTLLIGGGLVALALFGCGGVGVALFACGGFDYLKGLALGKSNSVAHEHLPGSCEAVVRVNLESLLTAPAVKERILPALDEQVQKDPDAGKLAAFFTTAQLDPKRDLTEAVVCISDLDANKPEVLAIIGGKLKKNGVVEALQIHADKDEIRPVREASGLKIIETRDEPFFISQAADGAILLANKESLLLLADKTSQAYEAYDLQLSEQVAGVVTAGAMRSLNDGLGSRNPLGAATRSLGRALMTVSLDTGKVTAHVTFGTANDAAEAAGAANVLLAGARREPPPEPKYRDVLDSVQVRAEGSEVIGQLVIPRQMIDDAAREIADGIREAEDKL